MDSLGIIAGKGAYPLELAASARSQGVEHLFAVAFKRETDPAIEQLVDDVVWMYVGQLGPFLEAFKSSGVNKAVMAGQITPGNLFNVRFDKPMRELLSRLPRKNADTIFGALGGALRGVGVDLTDASLFMEACMPESGPLTERKLTEQELEDARLGIEVARATTAMDIGQTVVIKEGTVLAVEAFEGTDEAIKRAGKLGGPGSVVVKMAGRGHDMRFDIPVIGARTLRSMKKAGATAMVIETKRTIILEREQVFAQADTQGVAMEAMEMEL